MISRYLVLRSSLRVARARAQLQKDAAAILGDPKLMPIHGMTLALLHRADITMETRSTCISWRVCSARAARKMAREELWDYTSVYEQVDRRGGSQCEFISDHPVNADAKRTFSEDDLTSGSFCFSRGFLIRTVVLWQWQAYAILCRAGGCASPTPLCFGCATA